MTVINLTIEREKRTAPDPEFVQRDAYGRIEQVCFTCSYMLAGREHSVHIWAKDWDDAEARVAAMREGLKVEGQIYSVVPA